MKSQFVVFFISFVVGFLLERYDKSTELLPTKSFLDHFMSWDALFFKYIAEKKYVVEHSLAFFPLMPLLAKNLSKLLNGDALISGILINNLCFCVSAILIYEVSLLLNLDSFLKTKKIQKETFALFVSSFFILNPVSIIYSTFYTESLFTMLILFGIYYKLMLKDLKAAFIFSIATLCRSNAIVFCTLFSVWYLPIIILPLGLFQYYSLLLMWRINGKFCIRIPYSYIQKYYWGQGFMKFYSLPMLPNFLFGLPFVFLSVYSIKRFHQINYFVSSAKFDLMRKLSMILLLKVILVVFFIHWNMAGRFLSFHPYLYIILADLYVSENSKKIIKFFVNYMIVYAVLFSAFYPPA